MKIMKVNSLIGNIVLINYKRAVYDMIKEYIKSGQLDNILEEFSESELLQSVNGLYLSGEYIRLSNSKDGKLLRLLNFGGPRLRATNILNRCSVSFGGAL